MITAAKKAKRKTVLVVDDNAAIRRAVCDSFLNDGFSSCLEAGTGKEAIEAASKFEPNLIVLDLSVPVMNGMDAAPILRELLPGTPIILFTQFAEHLQHVDLHSKGISAIAAKNDPIDDLIAKAHQVLGE